MPRGPSLFSADSFLLNTKIAFVFSSVAWHLWLTFLCLTDCAPRWRASEPVPRGHSDREGGGTSGYTGLEATEGAGLLVPVKVNFKVFIVLKFHSCTHFMLKKTSSLKVKARTTEGTTRGKWKAFNKLFSYWNSIKDTFLKWFKASVNLYRWYKMFSARKQMKYPFSVSYPCPSNTSGPRRIMYNYNIY